MSHTHHHDIDFKKSFTVENEPKSQVKISGEIPYEELLKERSAAIKSLGQNVSLDGFRKGHVPEAVLVKQIGETTILAEMAERVISHMYPHILEAHEIDAIGYPKLSINKLEADKPLSFTAVVAIIPSITLGEYTKLAKAENVKKASVEVSDQEVDEKITEILKQKAAYERMQNKAQVAPATEGELPATDTVSEAKEAGLIIPDLTDDIAKTLGQPGQFAGVDDLKTKLREHMEIEKKNDVTSAHRAKITDSIIEASTVELPQILIDSELGQMFAQMEEDLARSNLKMEDYLTHIKKTKDGLKEEWTPAAEKRAKLQLILNEIAKKEKISADAKLVEEQITEILTMYKDADQMRVRTYVTSVLTNEAVMKMLEEIK